MWTLATETPMPLWRPVAPSRAFTLAFSTRRGGVSPPPWDHLNLGRSTPDDPIRIEENRRRFLGSLGLSPESLATAGQVHGHVVTRIATPGHFPACDALVTTTPGLALAVTTADCMSILYTAPGAVAAAHSGWRGTAEGMPRVALEALCAAASVDPAQVVVHLGPCIRACCYEVGSEVAERFDSQDVGPRDRRWRLDLPGAAARVLREAGVAAEHIEDTGACTACEPHWYYSHRRDAGATGRHWAVAALRADGV
jgi:YfiH family protein